MGSPIFDHERLYPSHIPISKLQKAVLAIGSAFGALYDPTRQGKRKKNCKLSTVYELNSNINESNNRILLYIYHKYNDCVTLDLVAALTETTSEPFLSHIENTMLRHPMGQRILMEKPIIHSSTIDLNQLIQLKPGTLGREYAEWLKKEGVSPDTRTPVIFYYNFFFISFWLNIDLC